ncbi:alpha/beta fold hydrolase [Enemella sp. A6]|uniref:alpha/beta fold hydrolase n=1 Tax=Enemella sp. A6 TaxID=3440152 RepID=UPI003EB714D6
MSAPPEFYPALVLLPGTRWAASQWDAYHALLPGVRIITPDLPGHGRRAGEPFTGEAALAVISEAVAEAGPRPVLAGHSLGGYLAMAWAARHPHALSGLVPISATGDPGSRLAWTYRAFERFSTGADPERLALWTSRLMRWLGARGPLPDSTGYAALPAAWQYVLDEVGPETLRAVTCPVVLVNGRFDQMRAHVGRFAAAAHDVQVVTVPGATHLLPNTHPGTMAMILRAALDSAAEQPAR